MTTYYVSSITGSDNNNGTSSSAALASLQAAANLVKPGDTVFVMNGTYSAGGNDVLTITTSGTASAPITFEAAPGQTPIINTAGAWNGINIQASYIVVSGFTIVGDAANYNLQTALAGYSTGNSDLDGNGIGINPSSSVPLPNHITIENNTVYNLPGGGIYTEGADYVQILNNVVYGNANWSAYGNSGISVSTSANLDNNPGAHIVVSGNLVFGNAQLVPTVGGNTITDGEGIILDTNPGYTGQILVQNNTVYNNGGPGIESFLTANATISGNTVYGNNQQHTQAASDGSIFINQSSNNTVTNNITTAPSLPPPTAPVIASETVSGFAPAAPVTLSGAAAAYSTVTIFDNSAKLGTVVTNGSGVWTFTTAPLANGSQSFTATATDSVGQVSALSSPLAVTLSLPVNLITNGNFSTGDFTGWTLGGNYTSTTYGAEIKIDTNSTAGSAYAVGMGSMGADGTLSQTVATTPGQTYTLSFWLQNEVSGSNDFAVTWNGQKLLSLTNASQFGYTQYTYTVTATGNSSTLQFSAANGPAQWDLDNISLAASGASSSAPAISSIAESPASGDLNAGKTVTLTLNMNSIVTVAGGTPTLTLNDGGVATYTGGSGSNALTFSYTVGASDTNVASLAATAVNLNGATIKDGSGNTATLALSGLTQTGPQIDTTSPVVGAISETPSSGYLNAGKTVTYTITMSEAVTVNTAGGSPTLTFNDGGTGIYVGGSGTNTLTFNYTVLAGQNTPDLVVSSINLNGATLTDGAGNAANVSLTGIAQGSPEIDTTPPAVSSVSAAAGNYNPDQVLTLTLNMSEAVNVTGTPTLTLNDGGTATYAGGSGSNALTFSYTVASGQNTSALAVTAVNGTITDLAGNALTTTGLPETFTGVAIATATPVVTSVVTSGTGITAGSGDLAAGSVVTLTVNLNEAVTLAGGTPTLTLNDGGVATYSGGSGTNALTFNYTVATGQNTADLAVTAVNLNSATITDGSGNITNLSGAVGALAGTLQIDTTAPKVAQVVASPGTGEVTTNHTIFITLDMSEPVTLTGTPKLLLNDGGTATYDATRSSATALVFDYTVGSRQVTTDLRVSGITLPTTSSIRDLAGNNAVLTGAGADLALQINTTSTGAAGPSGGNLTIAKGAELELFGASKASVTFSSATGELKLDDSVAFTGRISGLTGADALDLSDISYGVNTKASFAGNSKGGTLTVTDGSHVTKIALSGNYLSSGWTLSSDGNGGTIVVDPPLSAGVATNNNGDMFEQRLALLTNHMAAAFTDAGATDTGPWTALESGSQSSFFLAQPVPQFSHHL